MSYLVEGLPYDDSESALVIAKRLFNRFKKMRSVIIYEVTPEGKQVHTTLAPDSGVERDCPTRSPDTIDMFAEGEA